MSIRTSYSCPSCGCIISPLNKKGFELLHTNIGIPIIKCTRCGQGIRSGHKPYSQMNGFFKIIECTKIFLNISVYSILFGLLIGFVLGFAFNEYILKTKDAFNFYIIGITILVCYWLMTPRYFAWSKKVEDHIKTKGEIINSNLYEHPDW